ncbi:MAG: hypothetical protein M3O00_17705 [Pseudomonadota bacterium]|nr:hypothetical protein [Pseudomonadota bacterium]
MGRSYRDDAETWEQRGHDYAEDRAMQGAEDDPGAASKRQHDEKHGKEP